MNAALIYLEALGASGRHAEMIRELEARWGGLEEFEEMWPNRDGSGGEMLAYLALAYRHLDDEPAFTDAMLRLRASLDAQLSEGADNWRMSTVQAYYALLADDFDSALEHIERMVEQGAVYNTAWKSEQSFVRPLRGEPRFEAARAIMIQRVNDAREELGLEPVDV